ncbi:Exodeoxyribonuclease I subunit D [Natronincola peptidivorans]|uniref:Nuclease SbcCD subunit D n=1 Tax=Natronincola peptidivorans TaxID=426128 RepID=A0A1I0DVX0_9FIRM|nr:exonuclease SbcCD subunit D [Natronincola peptidivorans]SET36655.1 Exodeoxyribonuclease I subunit D [Natronincola peptidivorans]
MRILHTSDWHLGRTLEGKSRLPEQRAFIDELCYILEKEKIQLVIIAGDVFDTYNPSAAAEELFYQAVERISDDGKRAVVAIAGNHDSPERLRAANPLAWKQGIYLLGMPGEDMGQALAATKALEEMAAAADALSIGKEQVNLVNAGAGWIEISIPDCENNAVITVLPYPSEKRLNELLCDSMEEGDLQKAYSQRVALALQEGAQHFRQDTVNIVTSHLYVLGGIGSDSERDIQLGGAFVVEPAAMPKEAHYVALGHLHRKQKIGGTEVPCYYSGSPLYYSFSESIQQKQVLVVDIEPTGETHVEGIPLTKGKPMYIKRFSSYQEAYDWCANEENQEIWLHLEIESQQPLSNLQLEELNKVHEGIIYRRIILPGAVINEEEEPRLQELSLEEQFLRFVAKETGTTASQELIDLFLTLAHDGGDENETD